MKSGRKLNRREFIRGSAAGAAALGITAAAACRVLGANDRINVGFIGCGGMGTNHLRKMADAIKKRDVNAQIVGVCDVFEPRRRRAEGISGAKGFVYYQKMLEMKELDAVWIATPDHLHATISMDAMEAGKDVYCEKPMTRYWEEAKKEYETVKRTGRVFQIGSQHCSQPCWHKAGELVKEGKIGKLVWTQSSAVRNATKGRDERDYYIDPKANPQNLAWEAFLGPAKKRPFNPTRFFRWRKFWDYSGGIPTEWFSHNLHKLLPVIGMEFPTRVIAGGGRYVWKGDREPPTTFHMVVDYPSGHSLMLLGCMVNETGIPTIVHGHKANMYIGGTIHIAPEPVFVEAEDLKSLKVRAPFSGDVIRAHHKNFLDCIRSRKTPNCPVEVGFRAMAAIALANLSYREGKVKLFDPEKLEIIQ